MDEEKVTEQESGTQDLRAQTSTKMPDATNDDDVQVPEPDEASLPAESHEQADCHGGVLLEPRTDVEVPESSESDEPNVE